MKFSHAVALFISLVVGVLVISVTFRKELIAFYTLDPSKWPAPQASECIDGVVHITYNDKWIPALFDNRRIACP